MRLKYQNDLGLSGHYGDHINYNVSGRRMRKILTLKLRSTLATIITGHGRPVITTADYFASRLGSTRSARWLGTEACLGAARLCGSARPSARLCALARLGGWPTHTRTWAHAHGHGRLCVRYVRMVARRSRQGGGWRTFQSAHDRPAGESNPTTSKGGAPATGRQLITSST